MKEACQAFPGHIIVGLDAQMALSQPTAGRKCPALKTIGFSQHRHDGVSAIVYTDIARDGMMQGVNVEATLQLAVEGGSIP